MEQKNVIKNVTSTALAIGLSFSIAGNGNGTMLINGNDYFMKKHNGYEEVRHLPINSAVQKNIDNIYIQPKTRNLDKTAQELFGTMRDATKEERESVDNYIKSISKNTGVNFFDIC